MNTSFERKEDSQEWYTPKWIIDALGSFDLDPCAPIEPPYKIAEHTFNVITDGLSQNWGGYNDVWLNPPYRHPLVDVFVNKMIAHNNGIALLFDRCDVAMWQKKIFPTASALMFMSGRVKFMQPNGTTKQGAGCGSILIAWGHECADRLKKSGIDGFFIDLESQKWNDCPCPKETPLLFKNNEGIGCGFVGDDDIINSTDESIVGSIPDLWATIPLD